MRQILIVADGVTRAQLFLPADRAEKVFETFLRESATPLLQQLVRHALTNGLNVVNLQIHAKEFDSED